MGESVLVPYRYAHPLWGGSSAAAKLITRQRSATKFRVYGSIVLVCAGDSTITTVIKMSVEDLATVITWVMTSHWVQD